MYKVSLSVLRVSRQRCGTLARAAVTIARLRVGTRPLGTIGRGPLSLPAQHGVAAPVVSIVARAHRRSLFIKVDATPNPDSMKFVPENTQVLPEKFGNGVHFSNAAEAKGSRLARRLLKVKEITGVFFGRDFISVNKTEDASWPALKPIVLDAMMDALSDAQSKGTPLVEEVVAAADTSIKEDDDEVVAMIKELLETRIRPAVQEDGGDIHFVGFDADTGVVKVRMAGSCVGCPSSTATLRNGVENMLMHYIPEVKGIEQVKASEAMTEGEKELHTLEQRLASAGAT